MSKKNQSGTETVIQKRINVWSLISILFPILFIVVLILPWSSMFVLRDDILVPAFIRWGSALATGLLMIVTGIIGLVRNKKNAGKFKVSWLGIIGIVIGALLFVPSAFFIGDYLVFTFFS